MIRSSNIDIVGTDINRILITAHYERMAGKWDQTGISVDPSNADKTDFGNLGLQATELGLGKRLIYLNSLFFQHPGSKTNNYWKRLSNCFII